MLTENRRYLGNVLPPVTVFELSKAKARALRERTDKPITNVARSGFTGAYADSGQRGGGAAMSAATSKPYVIQISGRSTAATSEPSSTSSMRSRRLG